MCLVYTAVVMVEGEYCKDVGCGEKGSFAEV